MASAERPSVKSPLFRGSFIYLTRTKKVKKEDGSEKNIYSIFMPLKKGASSTKMFLAELEKMVAKVTKEKFGAPVPIKKLKDYPVKDGDDMDNDQFHKHWCVNATANFKPHTVDKHGDTLEGEDEAYSGAWYKVKLSCYAWEYLKRRGISFNIDSAILLKDDEKFGGGSNAKEDFADDTEESDGDEEEGDEEDNDDIC